MGKLPSYAIISLIIVGLIAFMSRNIGTALVCWMMALVVGYITKDLKED